MFYAKSQNLLNEVIQVCKDPAIILIYDFDVLMQEFIPDLASENKERYDHTVNFDHLNGDGLSKVSSVKDNVALKIGSRNLGHLLLSSRNMFDHFVEYYNTLEPYSLIVEDLKKRSSNDSHELPVNIYYTQYQFNRDLA